MSDPSNLPPAATPNPTPDQIVAAMLHLPAEAVRLGRMGWNEDRIMRTVLAARLTAQIDERRRQLETISPEELRTKQGEIAGLKMAVALISKIET